MGSRNALAGVGLALTAPSKTREAMRLYMRGYMRRYRAQIDPVIPKYVAKVRLMPRTAWKEGHCRRCGLEASPHICGFCSREIERAA